MAKSKPAAIVVAPAVTAKQPNRRARIEQIKGALNIEHKVSGRKQASIAAQKHGGNLLSFVLAKTPRGFARAQRRMQLQGIDGYNASFDYA